jgi:hypothetical protein
MSSNLQWDVFVSCRVLAQARDLAPGENERRWSPISAGHFAPDHGAHSEAAQNRPLNLLIALQKVERN